MARKATVYTSIGALAVLLFVLIAFLVISISPKNEITGAVVANTETEENREPLPEGMVRIVNNGQVYYVNKESLINHGA